MRVLPYDERGEGAAVVLLHAGVGDRTMWHEHLEWLDDAGFRAIAPDLPGFGDADIVPGPQAPWDDVLHTLRELEVERATLVGNSFGAAVALRVAVVAPAAVGGLLLISPPPPSPHHDPSPELEAAWSNETAALGRGDVEATVEAVLEAWLQPQAPAALRERIARMQRRAIELQLAAGDVDEAPDPLERRPEAIERLRMPVLTATGGADMADFKLGAEEIARRTGGGMVVIAGAGHLAPLEAPDEFRAVLEGFLRDASRGRA